MPSVEQTREDLRLLLDAGFSLIRLYDAGAQSRQVLGVIREDELSMRVLLGAWLDAERDSHETCAWLDEPFTPERLAANTRRNTEELSRVIELANEHPDAVVAVNVGNEALVTWNDHLVSIGSMVGYLEQVRGAVSQPVTTADNYVAWVEHAEELGPAADFALIHSYPQWEGKDIDQAMPYTLENLAAVRAALPHEPMAIGEAGWASVAEEFGARASEEQQARYHRELMAWAEAAQVTTFFFEAFDEPWKGDPGRPLGAEKHWGLYTVDREPKLVMQGGAR